MRSRSLVQMLACVILGLHAQDAVIAAPTITSFLTSSPAQARVGEPVIITATGLASPVQVFFNGTALSNEAKPILVDLDRGLIIARVPAGTVGGYMRIRADGVNSPLHYFNVVPGSFDLGTNAVSGTVTKTGSALPGVILALHRGAQCGNVSFQDFAVSDSNGNYTLRGVDGPHQILVIPPKVAGVANISVPVVLSSTPATTDIALAEGTAVTGRVVDSSMSPLGDVRISIDSIGPMRIHEDILTDPSGVFTAHLLPGEHAYTMEPPLGAPHASASGSFTIDPTSTQNLGDTTLASGTSVTGNLVNATGGAPLASVELLAYDSSNLIDSVDTKRTAGDGSFRLVLPPNGTYIIRGEMDSRASVTDFEAPGVLVSNTPSVLNLATLVADIVSGTITLQGANTPLECVGVQALSAPSGFYNGFTRSGPDGTYRLRLAADHGGYIVNTSDTDTGPINYASKTWNGTPAGTYFYCEGTPVPAPIPGGSITPGIDFSLEPEAAIEGIVTRDDDMCVSDLSLAYPVLVDDGMNHLCNMGVPDLSFPGPGYRIRGLPSSNHLRACVYPVSGYETQCQDMITTTSGNTTPGVDFCLVGCTDLNWFADDDGDSFGDPDNTRLTCAQPAGYVADMTDCDDSDPDINPGQTERCDGLDNDCDTRTDEELGDTTCGIGACETTIDYCLDGLPQSCEPGIPFVESCNAIDDDCDGDTDEGLVDSTCGTGACRRTIPSCVSGVPQICIPGAPAAETCNGIDDDCNGDVDNGLGTTTCGVGACRRTVQNCVGGVLQTTCTPGTPTTEACDGLDNDCDGTRDEGNPGGGAACDTGLPGICLAGTTSCQRGGLACLQDVAPGMESCNGLDDDCDGAVDDVSGVCSIYMTHPMTGDVLDCRPGAVPPTLTWNPAQYDRYRVYVSADPAYGSKLSINSGDSLLKVPAWTIPANKWKNICDKATTNLYLRVYGVDNDVPGSDPTRTAISPGVIVTVRK